MNNEPVAWMDEDENVVFEKCKVYPIPLYTHPVKDLDEQFKKGFKAGKEEGWKAHKFHHPVKELTDEVIEQVRVAIMGAAYWCADENMPEAYNAVKLCCGQVLGILVKAQEK